MCCGIILANPRRHGQQLLNGDRGNIFRHQMSILRQQRSQLLIKTAPASAATPLGPDPDKLGDVAGDVDRVEHPASTAKHSPKAATMRQIPAYARIERPASISQKTIRIRQGS
jgi:hypothetical protein